MLKKLSLFGILALSLAWLGYVVFDIATRNNQFEPSRLFSSKDGSLIILQRPTEIDQSNFQELHDCASFELIQDLDQAIYSLAYISGEREQILLVNNESWNTESLKALFKNSDELKVSENELTFKNYTGKIYKTKLYLSAGTFEPGPGISGLIYDKKASALICTINSKNAITDRTEIYFQQDGIIKYVAEKNASIIGRKVNDELIFSKYLSDRIDSYHFKERDFWSTQDETYAKGPMLLWLNKGFVEVTIDGERALISDFLEGQDPDLVLNDFTQSFDTSRFSVPLTSTFPSKGKSYTFKFIDDVVIFAEKSSTCDRLISDFQLGQTLAMNGNFNNKLYNQLPQSVSERMFDKTNRYSTSVYRNEIHRSIVGGENKPIESKKSKHSSVSLALGQDISDFWYDAKNESCFIVGNNGKLAFYSKAKLQWEKNFDFNGSTKIEAIDLYDNGDTYYAFAIKDKLYLVDSKGNQPSGFPVTLDNDVSARIVFYRWKGNPFFLIPAGTSAVLLDGKGRELNILKVPINIKEQPVVWSSQSKLYAGVSGDSKFIMYDIDRKRIHREFELPSGNARLKIPNEVIHYILANGKLVKIDQKGLRTPLNDMEGAFVSSEHPVNRSLFIKSSGKLTLTNDNGMPYGEILLPSDDLTSMDVAQSNNGNTLVALLDGLENNVYLYQADGKKLTNTVLEGQRKVLLEANETGVTLTSIVGQFVVTYNINY